MAGTKVGKSLSLDDRSIALPLKDYVSPLGGSKTELIPLKLRVCGIEG
jgi:hypothetical protein